MNNAAKRAYEALAGQAGLTFDVATGTIYGQRNGFDILAFAADARYPYQLKAMITAGRAGGPLDRDTWRSFIKEYKPVSNVRNEGNVVEMFLQSSGNQEKFCANFIGSVDALIGFLIANGYTNCCQYCGQPVETGPYYVNGAYAHLCPNCAASVSQKLAMDSEQNKQKKDNVVTGIVGAFIGSILGVLCIVIIGQLGYVAAISGIIMAVCTLKGYELLGGKLTTKGIIISVVLMIVMTYIGDRIDTAILVTRELGYDFLYSFQIVPTLLDQLVLDAGAYWGNLALVYVFVLIGAVPTVYSAFKNHKAGSQMFKIGAR